MKTKLSLYIFSFIASFAFCIASPPTILRTPDIARLDPLKTETIYLQPLTVTSLVFRTKERMGEILAGSNIVAVKFNPTTRVLDLTPRITEGKTSLRIQIGKELYNFILSISSEEPDYKRTFTVDDDESDEMLTGLPDNVRAMRPDEIDTVRAINTIHRAQADRSFRDTLTSFSSTLIQRPYIWNASPVTLQDVTYFGDLDLIVLRIEWMNASDSVLHLEDKQVEVRIAGQPIPVTARQQLREDLFPGQMDTIWLFIQGYRILPKNNWELRLPPDASAVKQLLTRK